MAVNLYKGFKNEISGETFRCVSYTKEAFAFEWTVQPKGYIPFEHIHLNQDEIFHVKKGEIKIIIDGKEQIGKAGDTIVVPKGTRHIASNNKLQTLACLVECKPGLDNYTFFQCFGGLTLDNDIDKKGQINIPKMLFFSKKMKVQCITRPASVPAPLFKIALNICYITGSILGWQKLFKKYAGQPEIYGYTKARSGNDISNKSILR